MLVKEMIEKLQQFDPELELTISDGFEVMFYGGDFSVELFEAPGCEPVVDIGIGGLSIES